LPVGKKRSAFDPKVFLTKAGTGRTNLCFPASHVVYSQGDIAGTVFYLQNGMAKLSYTSKNGKEAVLTILGPGDFFGDRCLTGQLRRTASVSTMTECSIMQLDKTVMLRALRDEPKFSEFFIRHLLERHIQVGADLADQLINSSEMRLARTLLLLANFGKAGKQEPVIAKISQETLAEKIGTTRSRVSFFMNKFRRLGFIDYNGEMHGDLHVHSSLLNMVLHEGETTGQN